MAEDIQKIKDITQQYTLLTRREETDFVTLLHQSTPRNVKELRNLFEEDPRWVTRFYENYKQKKQTLKTNNASEWDRIIEKEVKEFSIFSE